MPPAAAAGLYSPGSPAAGAPPNAAAAAAAVAAAVTAEVEPELVVVAADADEVKSECTLKSEDCRIRPEEAEVEVSGAAVDGGRGDVVESAAAFTLSLEAAVVVANTVSPGS